MASPSSAALREERPTSPGAEAAARAHLSAEASSAASPSWGPLQDQLNGVEPWALQAPHLSDLLEAGSESSWPASPSLAPEPCDTLDVPTAPEDPEQPDGRDADFAEGSGTRADTRAPTAAPVSPQGNLAHLVARMQAQGGSEPPGSPACSSLASLGGTGLVLPLSAGPAEETCEISQDQSPGTAHGPEAPEDALEDAPGPATPALAFSVAASFASSASSANAAPSAAASSAGASVVSAEPVASREDAPEDALEAGVAGLVQHRLETSSVTSPSSMALQGERPTSPGAEAAAPAPGLPDVPGVPATQGLEGWGGCSQLDLEPWSDDDAREEESRGNHMFSSKVMDNVANSISRIRQVMP